MNNFPICQSCKIEIEIWVNLSQIHCQKCKRLWTRNDTLEEMDK